ncbi:hypothetical protein RHMOL_Rhmol05G0274300 [Rhododendron molle]|uniref:Uncharacterized protein n=1 Tax=Rhododendron molle TaxID=49168 RepID=A0ACC0NTS4_RHOML|nr:hypothetical protein RHMOL_Rhmol05G0274300 [Rhododendron molle]
MWNKLWSIRTAPKIRMFMWKAIKNWVACRDNLFRRKCITNPICDSANETIEHLLFHCPWSRAVWFGSGKAFWVFQNDITAVDKWMEDLLCECLAKETSKEMGDLFSRFVGLFGRRETTLFSTGRNLS